MARRLLLGMLGLLLIGCASHFSSQSELPLPYRQAEDAFRLGQYDRAVRGYQIFIQRGDHEELVPRAFYKMAQAELHLGHYDRSLQVIGELEARYPKERWPQIYLLRGDVEAARGNLVSAVRWWEEGWRIADGTEKQKLRNRIEKTLATMPEDGLKGAASVLTTPEMRALAQARLRTAANAGAEPMPSPASLKPEVAGAAAAEIPAEDARVACLLPMSGPYAAYGKDSLNGIRLALGSRASTLLVADEGGDPQQATAALEGLIADRRVIAVIGPLRSEVAEAIAPRAEKAGLPMILLSQRDMAQGHYVVPLALTPSRQAARLVEYAIGTARLSRFGVIHPSDPYGSALAEAFTAEVTRKGGRIVGAIAYARDAREFAVEALALKRWREQDTIQAVFLPDYAATVVPLVSQLRAAVPDIAFLGSNGWDDARQLSKAAAQMEGAVFVDGFFAGSERPATRAFVAAYQAEYGTPPGILEAQAYDAAMLVRRAFETGVRSRAAFVPRLRLLGAIEGAGGRIAFGPGGVDRQPFLLTVTNGMVRELGVGARGPAA
jgi:ABC-type branched-subunit amino acid transport system substrate-binding protein